MAEIVIVEDEASLRADLVEYLGACGHSVTGCEDGSVLERTLATVSPDIVILDVNLPGENGFSIASRLRERSAVGIIMLTARTLGVDRVVGLEVGADVYLTKPVELRELEAQIRALARRLGRDGAMEEGPAAEPSPPRPGEYWVYDSLSWTLVAPGGRGVKLTSAERVFIALLAARPGEAINRPDIMSALGKRYWDPMDRSIDSMVRRLRAKSRAALGTALPVEAVHGVGYAFTAPVTVSQAER
jgi:DNA-binding response OmpR family regulator